MYTNCIDGEPGRRDWLGGIGGRSQNRQLSSFDSRRMGISLTQQGQKVD